MYRDSVYQLAKSAEFNDAFEKYVCDSEDPINNYFELDPPTVKKIKDTASLEEGAVQLRSVIMQLDALVHEKSIELLQNGVKWLYGDRASIRRTLEKIIDLYSAIYPNETCFRACIFVPDHDSKYLRPWLWANTEISCPIDFNFETENNPNFDRSYFAFDGDSAVSRSWDQSKVISTSREITDLVGVVTPVSIMALPICCEEDQLQAARDASLDLERKFGVLCIVSNEEKIFTTDREVINKSLVDPFVSRIILESIQAYVSSLEDRKIVTE